MFTSSDHIKTDHIQCHVVWRVVHGTRLEDWDGARCGAIRQTRSGLSKEGAGLARLEEHWNLSAACGLAWSILQSQSQASI